MYSEYIIIIYIIYVLWNEKRGHQLYILYIANTCDCMITQEYLLTINVQIFLPLMNVQVAKGL